MAASGLMRVPSKSSILNSASSSMRAGCNALVSVSSRGQQTVSKFTARCGAPLLASVPH